MMPRLVWILVCFLGGLPAGAEEASRTRHGAETSEESHAQTTFRYVKNQILVDVVIGGEGPFTFLVDTGVTPSAIDVELARKLDLPAEQDNVGEASGAGTERVQIFPVLMTEVKIAGAAVGDVDAVAAPLMRLGQKLGEPLHGILGHSFLKTRVVRIDYRNRTLAFAPSPAPFAADFGRAEFVTPLKYGEGDILPVVDVTIGENTIVASIDTGSSLGLEIFSDAVERLGLSETVRGWSKGEITGARGSAEISSGSLPEVSIGPLTFRDVAANVGTRRGGDYRDANIGNRMWRNYVLVFDYVDRRVAFRKNSK